MFEIHWMTVYVCYRLPCFSLYRPITVELELRSSTDSNDSQNARKISQVTFVFSVNEIRQISRVQWRDIQLSSQRRAQTRKFGVCNVSVHTNLQGLVRALFFSLLLDFKFCEYAGFLKYLKGVLRLKFKLIHKCNWKQFTYWHKISLFIIVVIVVFINWYQNIERKKNSDSVFNWCL